MVDLAIILIIWAILYIIAFVFIPAWRKRRDAGKGLYERSQDDNKLSVNYALKKLGCKVKWMTDHEDLVARYEYQGGHFNIRLEKNSPYVRLSYFYFFEAVPHDLEMVRAVCNECNLNTETCCVVYTIDDKTGTADIHIVSSLMVTDSTVVDVLERAMGNTFKWQNIFVRRYNELLPAYAKDPNHDLEKGQAGMEHEMFLLREMELTHQAGEADGHLGQGEDNRLRHLLATAMGLDDIVPAHFAAYGKDWHVVLDDTDDILDFDITTPLIEKGCFKRTGVVARLDYYDPRNPVKMRHMTLDFEQEGTTRDTLYYRITMSIAPVTPVNEVEVYNSGAPKQQASVLIGYDLTPQEERIKKFRYLMKEALAKANGGQADCLSNDERLLIDMDWPDMNLMAYRAQVLFEQKRFYEAAGILERIYDTLSANRAAKGAMGKKRHQKLYFMLGVCYGCLRQYEKALYFLQQTEPFANEESARAYVNCLVNKKDHRALNIIDNMIHLLQELTSQQQEDDQQEELNLHVPFEEVEHLYNFLSQRKAYLLVSTGNYEEAERLLKMMLDSADNSDFALKELAYIQKNKSQQAKRNTPPGTFS